MNWPRTAAVIALAIGAAAAPSASAATAHHGAQHGAHHIYYVAPSGSDAATGSWSHPLRTISQCLREVRPGDTCLVHAGRYREQVSPPSGTADAPITVAAYGDGKVILDGTEQVTGWQDAGGGIVAADTDLPLDPAFNAVFLDGGRAPEGRWPASGPDPLNAQWAQAGTTSTAQHIDDAALPDGDWTGATVHIWAGSNPWAQQTGVVTASTHGALDFTGGDYRCPFLCMGNKAYRNYYLVGSKATLKQPGDWYYDSTAHRLYLVPPAGGIAGHKVAAKTRIWGLDLSQSSYVNVRGLDLFGTSARTGTGSTGDVLQGLHASFISEFSTLPMPADSDLAIPPFEGNIVASRILDSGIQILGTGNTLSDSEVSYSAGDGVLVRGTGNTVTNDYIHDVGWMGSYTPGIEVNGSDQTITHNTIRRTGRASIDVAWQLNGVPFHGNRIAYNDLSEAMRTSRDGSPFYACCQLDATGTSVDHNTVHDADGQVGYYVDNSSGHFLLHDNVAWNTGQRGTFFNGNKGPSVGNQDHNSSYGVGIDTASVLQSNATDASGTYVSNDVGLMPVTTATVGNPAPIVRSNLISANPLFTDPVNGELWLRPGSPAIGNGETIPGLTGNAPDQGAYQYADAVWAAGCSLPGCVERVQHGTWTATASDGTDASAAVDGDINTRWTGAAAMAAGQWLTVDLGAAKTFDRLSLDAGRDTTGQPYGFSVSVSDDGTHWGAPVAVVSGRSFTQDAVFSRVTARYLRLTLTQGGPNPWVVNDLRLYASGPDAALPVQAELAESVRGPQPSTAASGVLRNGDWLRFDSVEFGTGAREFTARLAASSSGGRLEVHLDRPDGPSVGSLAVTGTGGVADWSVESARLRVPVTGTHTVYLVARGAAQAAIDWWAAN